VETKRQHKIRFEEVCRSKESVIALVKLSDVNRIPETDENLTTGAYEVFPHVHRNCSEPLSENVGVS
jgi:hypothetical protein